MSEPIITEGMVCAGVEQARVDSSLTMVAKHRVERILRAALTGVVDRAALDASLTIIPEN